MRRKTNEQFRKEVYDLVGNEYTFLDAYVNTMTKLRVKHNKCGHVYKVRPNDFFKGYRCPFCAKLSRRNKLAKTNDQFKQEVYDLVGNEYVFLDKYFNALTKLRVKHNTCGHIYKVQPNAFLHGCRCPYCAGLIKKTDTQFKKEVYDLVGNEYIFLDPYVSAVTKLRVKHNRCGNTYKVTPSHFLSGYRCPYCATNAKTKTNTEFQQEVFDLVGNEYIFLDPYVNNYTKLRVKHNECGNIYKVTPANFLRGSRCPYCNSPKGELIISKILGTLNINYESQKTFSDLKDTQPLSYDFYIPDQNILIEYQGIQHYESIDYFGGKDRFKYQKKHDKLKSDYAKSHNYKLIAVPYTEDTFFKIKKYLIKHGITK